MVVESIAFNMQKKLTFQRAQDAVRGNEEANVQNSN